MTLRAERTFRAWRLWRVRQVGSAPMPGFDDSRPRLKSINCHSLWPYDRPLEAFPCSYCRKTKVELDRFGRVNANAGELFSSDSYYCGCGIHAVLDPAALLSRLDDLAGYGALLGEVDLWGTVQPHEKGYRAQFARPVSLFYPWAQTKAGMVAAAEAEGNTASARYIGEQMSDWMMDSYLAVADAYGVPLASVEEQSWGRQKVGA